ncbi:MULTISPECIES: hypothetical protein [unclassified Bacillus (in: firmicutes)]|uniref:hypothetical protein n=1 Tax=unclassified Bacillus (in: firmicutes) TaxID=185979 RepID=UPI0008E0C5BD|nr:MULTISPECIES: hypothetical protein [unclassified Bacillus (in: firmicutes)]SFB19944.1 hypothetical protein SAMN02799634_10849 [Bacillus sp. UNCCL13]SFQ90789.1 hypothetical protein SAMN04488577_3865 [Bacillus sp. cl95]
MVLNVEHVYRKGIGNINEDAYVLLEDEGIFSAIDGATGLGGLSGSIAAEILREAIAGGTGQLVERVIKGNDKLREEAVSAFNKEQSFEDIPKHMRSSCGLAAVKINQVSERVQLLDYVTAGDCILFVQYVDGRIRQVNIDHIDPLDGIAIKMLTSYWIERFGEENPNALKEEEVFLIHKEFREKICEVLKINRNKLNTVEGYGIIDGSKEAEWFLEKGTIPLINVKKILLLSDGMKIHSPRKNPLSNEWLHTAEIAFAHGLEYLEKMVLDMENSDPACYDYPRLKKHDDKTGILVEL